MNSSYPTHQWNRYGWFSAYLCTRGIFPLLVAVFSLGLSVAGEAAEFPSTPAGKVLAGYLDALNSGTKDKLEAFIKAHRPDRPDALDRMLDLRWNTGGFDLYSIESSQALNIQAVLHEREGNGTYNRMSVTVSDGTPAVITHITLVRIPPPAGAPVPERLSERAAVAAWEAEIDKAAANGKFSGVWLWAKNGKVITSGAKGKADREKGIDNTLNTKFRIGSMNKMFTAVATLQLVERGKLSLDDTIGKVLPDYPNTNVASKVKVRHLLSHTGGTGDIFGPEFEAHRLELKTLQDYVKLYGKRDLQFEPGTKWEYSNYGMLLLGVLIEKVSGKSYYDFVAENIYKVAGMTNSGSEPESVEVANRSKGYMRDQFEMVSNEPTLPWRGTSAGGGYTTAPDLIRADVEKTVEGRDAGRGHARAIHHGRLRLRIPDRATGRGADLRPRRRRSGNERDSARVSGIGPVGDRAGQPGPAFGSAPGRLAACAPAAEIVPTTDEASLTLWRGIWPRRRSPSWRSGHRRHESEYRRLRGELQSPHDASRLPEGPSEKRGPRWAICWCGFGQVSGQYCALLVVNNFLPKEVDKTPAKILNRLTLRAFFEATVPPPI